MTIKLRSLLTPILSPSGLSFLSTIFNAVVGFASFSLLARTLAPHDLGKWVIFISGSVFFDMLRFGLVQNSLVKHFAGADDRTQSAVEGSGIILHGALTLLIVSSLTISRWLFPEMAAGSVFSLFLLWYPVYALVSIPHAFAEWISQARNRFDRVLTVRIAVRLPFLLFLLACLRLHEVGIERTIMAFVVVNALASAFVLAMGWISIRSVLHTRRQSVYDLFHFGKFSAWTAMGTSLLRSSDMFIIGHCIGSAATAMYGVPMKLLEVIELPIRSLGAAAFPAMSIHSQKGDTAAMRTMFLRSVGNITAILAPFLVAAFVFAEQLVTLIGGEGYRSTAVIIRILTVYCLLIPFDRYTGIVLDSLGKPRLNALKVWLMLAVNVVGDLIAVYLTHEIWAIAFTSIATFIFGSVLNLVLLRRTLGLSITSAWFSRYCGRRALRGIDRFRTAVSITQGPANVELVLRRCIYASLYYTGLPLLARWVTRRRMRAIVFHSIASSPECASTNRFLHSTVGVFERQIAHLSRFYRPVSAADFLSFLKQDPVDGRHRVLVTFDDGFKNTATVAAPILRRHGVPFLVAMISRVQDEGYIPWDIRISLALTSLRRNDSRNHPRDLFASHATRFIRNPHPVRRSILDRLKKASGLRWTAAELERLDPELAGMSWEDARALIIEHRGSLAAHTMSHAVLNHYTDDEIAREVAGSRIAIERATGETVNFFVYPTGVVDERIKRQIRHAGFSAAFGLSHRFISTYDDRFDLGRIGIPPHASYEEFVCRVSGLLAIPVSCKRFLIRWSDRLKRLPIVAQPPRIQTEAG